ncbi:MAG: MFS transporter [Moritella sp.]|uniref:MFS transporter n=1 Tax=Moritella sp. TaxID=78556 RepID=UPI0025EB1D6B|nr:MFS transporter [Moritella sp.]NQZ92547.1 MFS transporter [Moritella sp.]
MENIQKMPLAKTGISKWFSLVIILLAQMGTMGDNSGLSVATSSLINDLGASVADVAFANAMYPLIAGACMIAGGMLGLILGWTRLFQLGTLLMFVAEAVAAYTDNMQVFIFVARGLSGIGASFLVPAVLGLIAGIYKGKDRALAFGAIAAIIGVANTVGPLLFGYIIDVFDYRVAFTGLAGYFAILTILGFFLDKVEKSKIKIKYDLFGTVLVSSGLLALFIGLLKITEWGLVTPINPEITVMGISPSLPLVALGLTILFAFLKWEKKFEQKHGACLMPESFVKTPQLRDGLYMCGFIFVMFGAFVMLGITYLQLVAEYSAFDTAKVMMLFSIGMMVSSIAAPIKLNKISCRTLCNVGIGFCGIAAIFGALGSDLQGINYFFYACALFIGIGTGLVASQASLIVTEAVNERDATQSGGVQATSRNIGQTVGIALLGTTMMFSLTGSVKSQAEESQTLSVQAKYQVEQIASVPFLSDSGFEKLWQDKITEQKDIEILVDINRSARQSSVRLAWYLLALICVGFSLGMTRSIPKRSLSLAKD